MEDAMGSLLNKLQRSERRTKTAAWVVLAMWLGAIAGSAFWVGGITPRREAARLRARLEAPVYLGTREFGVAGGGMQYVVSYLRDDTVYEVPTYSPEARDELIEWINRRD